MLIHYLNSFPNNNINYKQNYWIFTQCELSEGRLYPSDFIFSSSDDKLFGHSGDIIMRGILTVKRQTNYFTVYVFNFNICGKNVWIQLMLENVANIRPHEIHPSPPPPQFIISLYFHMMYLEWNPYHSYRIALMKALS